MNKKVLAALGLTSNVSAYKCQWKRNLFADSTCATPAGLLDASRQQTTTAPAYVQGTKTTWQGMANVFEVADANKVEIGTCAKITYTATNMWDSLNTGDVVPGTMPAYKTTGNTFSQWGRVLACEDNSTDAPTATPPVRVYGGIFYTLFETKMNSATPPAEDVVGNQCATPLVGTNNGETLAAVAAAGNNPAVLAYAQTGGARQIMSGSGLCAPDGTTTKTPEQKQQGTNLQTNTGGTVAVTGSNQSGYKYKCQNSAINGGFCNDSDYTTNAKGTVASGVYTNQSMVITAQAWNSSSENTTVDTRNVCQWYQAQQTCDADMVRNSVSSCGVAYAGDTNTGHTMFPNTQVTKDTSGLVTNDPQYCWKPASCAATTCTQLDINAANVPKLPSGNCAALTDIKVAAPTGCTALNSQPTTCTQAQVDANTAAGGAGVCKALGANNTPATDTAFTPANFYVHTAATYCSPLNLKNCVTGRKCTAWELTDGPNKCTAAVYCTATEVDSCRQEVKCTTKEVSSCNVAARYCSSAFVSTDLYGPCKTGSPVLSDTALGTSCVRTCTATQLGYNQADNSGEALYVKACAKATAGATILADTTTYTWVGSITDANTQTDKVALKCTERTAADAACTPIGSGPCHASTALGTFTDKVVGVPAGNTTACTTPTGCTTASAIGTESGGVNSYNGNECIVPCIAADWATANSVPQADGSGFCTAATDFKFADNCAVKTAANPTSVIHGGTILGYNKCYTTSGNDEAPTGCQQQYLQSTDIGYTNATTDRTTSNSYAVKGEPAGNLQACDIKTPCNTTCSRSEINAAANQAAGTMCKGGNLTTPNVVVTKKGGLGAYVNDACWVNCVAADWATANSVAQADGTGYCTSAADLKDGGSTCKVLVAANYAKATLTAGTALASFDNGGKDCACAGNTSPTTSAPNTHPVFAAGTQPVTGVLAPSALTPASGTNVCSWAQTLQCKTYATADTAKATPLCTSAMLTSTTGPAPCNAGQSAEGVTPVVATTATATTGSGLTCVADNVRPPACNTATADNKTLIGAYLAKVDSADVSNYVTYTMIKNDYTWADSTTKATNTQPCPVTSSQFYPMPTSGGSFNNDMKAYLCSKKLFGLC